MVMNPIELTQLELQIELLINTINKLKQENHSLRQKLSQTAANYEETAQKVKRLIEQLRNQPNE
jgi:regulator of replication initiation timing